jgi:peptide/nickel transport system permease protein
VQTGQTSLILELLKRALIFAGVLVVVNVAAYVVTNFMALRGPMAYGYISNTRVPVTQVLQGYPEYVSALLRGDLGRTDAGFATRLPGDAEILPFAAESLAHSLILLGIAFLVSALIGTAVGLLSVNPRSRRANLLALVASLAGFSMPGFYLGILMLMLIFSLAAQGRPVVFLPVSGYGLDEHLILPVLALSVRPTAEIARLTAELLVEELGKQYIRLARAKGLPWRLVVLRHAYRNIAATIITALGNSLSYLLGSLVIIEQVFGWPGLGRALLQSIQLNDFAGTVLDPTVIATLATVSTVLYLVIDLFIEFTRRAIDPRLRGA